jgi:hypothetical protein
MPRVVDGLAAGERARMLGDNPSVPSARSQPGGQATAWQGKVSRTSG